jgi:5-methyltetrahydropteroyltriglutamate--homocysteine methyltransferase
MPINPRFRAEHVGSLLRPPALKDAFTIRSTGEISENAYEAALTDAIARAVDMQEEVGLHSITDGEFGRSSWFGFFFERMSGFRLEPSAFKFKDGRGQSFEWPTCYACERIQRHSGITTDEYLRLRKLTRQTPKMTMPSPSAFHFFRLNAAVDPEVYPDPEQYWEDLVSVYRSEVADLAALGCSYIQLDEVPLAMLCDPSIQEQVRGMGSDPQALIGRYVDVLERILSAAPSSMTVGLHLCRGNFRSRWMAAGGYEPIAERLFNAPSIDAFFLEYDSERAGDFSPLRFVPKDKVVVLGLISSKTAALEPIGDIKKRIDEAAKFVPLDQLSLSPQCGFASVAGGNTVTEADERAKLKLVVDIARAVWKD